MIDEKYLRLYLNKDLAFAQRRNGYAARQEIAALVSDYARDPRRLEPFGFKVYSQAEEDGIIEEIFRRLGVEQDWYAYRTMALEEIARAWGDDLGVEWV